MIRVFLFVGSIVIGVSVIIGISKLLDLISEKIGKNKEKDPFA